MCKENKQQRADLQGSEEPTHVMQQHRQPTIPD
jgi:hypothetical protein